MSAGIGTQITPLECRMVKAISSGVALEAAKMMSPSFSRSSSSTTITAPPAAMSAMARSTVSSRNSCVMVLLLLEAALQQPLDVLGEDVHLEVDGVADPLATQRGAGQGLGDQADGEA